MEKRNRRKEGQLIKRAIKKALPDDTVRVEAGKGTAYGWWSISVDSTPANGCSCTYESWGTRNNCNPCQAKYSHIRRVAELATMKSGAEISRWFPDMGGTSNEILIQVDLNQPNPTEKAEFGPSSKALVTSKLLRIGSNNTALSGRK